MIAEREQGSGFVQFAVVAGHGAWVEIESGLPEADWSRPGFDAIAAHLRAAGFAEAPNSSAEEGMRFLRARAAGTPEIIAAAGQRIAEIVSRELQWREPTFSVRYNGFLRQVISRGA